MVAVGGGYVCLAPSQQAGRPLLLIQAVSGGPMSPHSPSTAHRLRSTSTPCCLSQVAPDQNGSTICRAGGACGEGVWLGTGRRPANRHGRCPLYPPHSLAPRWQNKSNLKHTCVTPTAAASLARRELSARRSRGPFPPPPGAAAAVVAASSSSPCTCTSSWRRMQP